MRTERRYCDIKNIELREDGEEMIIEGNPIVFDTYTYFSDDFAEVIDRGAVDEVIGKEEKLLWQHDFSQPMAAVVNKTLEAKADKDGVKIRADVSGSKWGRDGYEAIKNGLVDKMSFGFIPSRVTYEERKIDGKSVYVRIIEKIGRLLDYSPVSFPQYAETTVSARSVISENDRELGVATAEDPEDHDSTGSPEPEEPTPVESNDARESERLKLVMRQLSLKKRKEKINE
jgi:uncharacterized protein